MEKIIKQDNGRISCKEARVKGEKEDAKKWGNLD